MMEDSNLSMESVESVPEQRPPSIPLAPVPEESVITENPESTQSSVVASVSSTPRSLARVITADVTHRQVEVKDLIEYEWPLKSGDKYFLQVV
ncbi:unnamed protein product [Strongylus vulgaris]|uniref:Uncharacterized protein n=1 Tax=Strongylus vulgaris TaxID=40348 RepID=A0A3P7J4R3_STRVU|nr:unnamed protein product [Strongylus vulgaris]